jgi:hypothetical protein
LVGQFPKNVEISVSDVVMLEGAWTAVAPITRSVDISDARIINLDVNQLFGVGQRLTQDAVEVKALTAKEAKPRLAWTYGVPEENVKINIEF